ncbi:MAG: glycosyltransferase family 87 protein [Pseudomonadota bacterium]
MSDAAALPPPHVLLDRALPETANPVLTRALAASLVMLILYGMTAHHVFFFPVDPTIAHLEDYVAFWLAAKESVAGRLHEIYDPAAFRDRLPAYQALAWLFTPAGTIMFSPLAWLPYGPGKAFFYLCALAAIVGGGRALGLRGLWLAALALAPGLYVVLFMGQAAALFAGLMTAGLAFSRTRPILAGLCIALLTSKPQYGLLIPVFLAARGEWRTVGWTVLFTIALHLASIALYGLEAWRAFFATLGGMHFEHMGKPHPMMVAVKIHLVKWGAPLVLANAIQLAALAGMAWATWVAARRFDRATAIAVVLIGTFLASPYVWHYDMGLAAIGIALLAARGPALPLWGQAALAVLWFCPPLIFIVTPVQLFPTVPFAAGLGLLAVFLVARPEAERVGA